jgi:hypothetical protein
VPDTQDLCPTIAGGALDLLGNGCPASASDLATWLKSLPPSDLAQPFANSLIAKANAASRLDGTQAGDNILQSMLQEAEAQRGQKISSSVVDRLELVIGFLLGK